MDLQERPAPFPSSDLSTVGRLKRFIKLRPRKERCRHWQEESHEPLPLQPFPWKINPLGVFAPLVGALVFKTSVGFEQSSKWVRFPYTPVSETQRHTLRQTD